MGRLLLCILTVLVTGLILGGTTVAVVSEPSGSEQYTLAPDDPDYSSMPDAPGKDEVYGFCSSCHSMKIVTQQNLSRKRWDKLLVWMVEEQGMAPLPEDDRKLVLDYLAEHYGSKGEHASTARRAR